jgi:hypothetical protein
VLVAQDDTKDMQNECGVSSTLADVWLVYVGGRNSAELEGRPKIDKKPMQTNVEY